MYLFEEAGNHVVEKNNINPKALSWVHSEPFSAGSDGTLTRPAGRDCASSHTW